VDKSSLLSDTGHVVVSIFDNQFDPISAVMSPERFVFALAHDRERSGGPLGTAHLGDLCIKVIAHDRFAIDLGDDVSRFQSGLLRRRVLEYFSDFAERVAYSIARTRRCH
jgi:hypothetical protein